MKKENKWHLISARLKDETPAKRIPAVKAVTLLGIDRQDDNVILF